MIALSNSYTVARDIKTIERERVLNLAVWRPAFLRLVLIGIPPFRSTVAYFSCNMLITKRLVFDDGTNEAAIEVFYLFVWTLFVWTPI